MNERMNEGNECGPTVGCWPLAETDFRSGWLQFDNTEQLNWILAAYCDIARGVAKQTT